MRKPRGIKDSLELFWRFRRWVGDCPPRRFPERTGGGNTTGWGLSVGPLAGEGLPSLFPTSSGLRVLPRSVPRL